MAPVVCPLTRFVVGETFWILGDVVDVGEQLLKNCLSAFQQTRGVSQIVCCPLHCSQSWGPNCTHIVFSHKLVWLLITEMCCSFKHKRVVTVMANVTPHLLIYTSEFPSYTCWHATAKACVWSHKVGSFTFGRCELMQKFWRSARQYWVLLNQISTFACFHKTQSYGV